MLKILCPNTGQIFIGESTDIHNTLIQFVYWVFPDDWDYNYEAPRTQLELETELCIKRMVKYVRSQENEGEYSLSTYVITTNKILNPSDKRDFLPFRPISLKSDGRAVPSDSRVFKIFLPTHSWVDKKTRGTDRRSVPRGIFLPISFLLSSHGPPHESHEWIRGGVPSESFFCRAIYG